MDCRLWGHTESDMSEATQQQQQHLLYNCKSVPLNPFHLFCPSPHSLPSGKDQLLLRFSQGLQSKLPISLIFDQRLLD